MKTKILLMSAVCALAPSVVSAQDAGNFYMREVLIPKRVSVSPDPAPPAAIPDPGPSPTPAPTPTETEPSQIVCSEPQSTIVNIVIKSGTMLTQTQGKTVEKAREICQNYANSSGQEGTCGWTKSSGRVGYWWASGGSGTGYRFNALMTCEK